MATVLLQVVGAAVGGAIGGPFGATLGRAIGGIAGYALDQRFFSKDQVIQGPRLDSSRFLTSSEGAAIPKAYGQTRLGGQIIWATRFREVKSTSSSGGGKGGGGSKTKVTKYTYFCSFAVGICDGPITGIRRVWADGKEIDLTKVEYRLYTGTQDQQPDPLIEAKQGLGNAPAYRGAAYIVFESLPLAKYGNRVPQISVEVIRAVDRLGSKIRSISVIPGATEFGYHPKHITRSRLSGITIPSNRHNSIAVSDWEASIDELQMLCPNLESVALVVAWFGTDLRAQHCEIRPGVEYRSDSTTIAKWKVSGTDAAQAHEVSRNNGNPAYGGTPSDHSVIEAIADLKSRGLKVILYPFVLMDIPDGNALPDPYGNSEQAAYPWRGMITCDPAIGMPSTSDQTSIAVDQIAAFSGEADISDFVPLQDGVEYTGPQEWSLRRMILHYAKLGEVAGGLDGYLIGSEMRGLTAVRDDASAFPFVSTLVLISDDVKAVLGNSCTVTYAADWSEYYGYHPADGSGDLYFNLDPLWANASIDAVGIDNYMPLSDVRDGDEENNVELGEPWSTVEQLRSQIAGGEGFDWYYASANDRLDAIRTPITDGYNEPWVWRYKDLVSWWSNSHKERSGGVPEISTTVWQPRSKPILFTELGCPAIDKGSNQPNVFYDAKSDQSSLPYFSSGGRDDLVQNRFLNAHLSHWDVDDPEFDALNNPISSAYSDRMVSLSDICLWTWDARPFPWFPNLSGIWSDGENWQRGHWLNGQLTGCPLDSLITAIMLDYGFQNFRCEVDGFVDGYLVPDAVSLRRALDPLLSLFGIFVTEEDGEIVFRSKAYCPRASVPELDLVQENERPTILYTRDHEAELPYEALISHATVSGNYEQTGTKTRRLVTESERQVTMSIPMVASPGVASAAGEERIRDFWIAQNKLQIGVSQKHTNLTPGDIITVDHDSSKNWVIERTEAGIFRVLKARAIADFPKPARNHDNFGRSNDQPSIVAAPFADLMDLPLLDASSTAAVVSHLAIFAQPWAGTYAALSSPSTSGYELRGTVDLPATVGELLDMVEPGPEGRWDHANTLRILLYADAFASATSELVLNGANALAIESNSGDWEILQFTHAELQNDGSWVLSGLLRAQFGTEAEMRSGGDIGNRVVVLNEAIAPIPLRDHEKGLNLNWQIGPADDPYGSDTYVSLQHTNFARSQKPISPVHLSAVMKPNGDTALQWIRRSRVDADSWVGAEIPLGESSERYQIRVLNDQGVELRVLKTVLPSATYSSSMQIEDFGSGAGIAQFSIAQIASSGLPGAERSIYVSF